MPWSGHGMTEEVEGDDWKAEWCSSGRHQQVLRDLLLSNRRENGLSEKTHRHQSSSHMPRTLYQTILGPEFDKAPAEIRRMHSFARVARGTADITRGSSWGARLICRLAKLPEAQMGVPVETSFEPIVGGERWTRRFDGQPFQTDMAQCWMTSA